MGDIKNELASEFKVKSQNLARQFIAKLKEYKGPLPVSPQALEGGVFLFLGAPDPSLIIENAIMFTSEYWHLIKDRDENGIISMSSKLVDSFDPSTCPVSPALIKSFIKFEVEDDKDRSIPEIFHFLLEFSLKKRDEILGPEFEETLWVSLDDLIRTCIKYTHHRRFPKPNEQGVVKYTVKFAPSLSVKNEAEKWGVVI